MLIKDSEAVQRLGSPLNLINKLKDRKNSNQSSSKNSKAMSLFVPGKNSVQIAEQNSNPLRKVSPAVPSFNPFADRVNIIPQSLPADVRSQSQDVRINEHNNLPPTAESNTNSADESVKIEDLLDGADNKIHLATAHNEALSVLNSALTELKLKITEVNPGRLPSVIQAASKVVEGIRRERNESAKNGGNKSVHYHFYTPHQKTVSDYEVIEVN